MSTGYGKSAIYQLAGELLDGPATVVSPLTALQRDQVEAIEEAAPGEAAELNSTLSERRRRELMESLREGEREFVLLAPEQLAKEEVLEELRVAEPSLPVVDEAHCISEWGHDFRPDYLRLGAFAAERRGELQSAFMDDEIEAIVATTAFGWGSTSRTCASSSTPASPIRVDSYYQEVGRAGRDGEPAQACVFYRPEDQAIRRFFAGGGPKEREEYERSRLEMMRSYAEHSSCRRDFVLSYFGEEHEPPCGNCDNCDAGLVESEADVERPFGIGATVTHSEWGEGEVRRYDANRVVVLFESVGYRTLDLELIEEKGLLQAA